MDASRQAYREITEGIEAILGKYESKAEFGNPRRRKGEEWWEDAGPNKKSWAIFYDIRNTTSMTLFMKYDRAAGMYFVSGKMVARGTREPEAAFENRQDALTELEKRILEIPYEQRAFFSQEK